MYTIGDFARLGGVSVRMLRHYDATGLLVPARVDPVSGYRSYAGAQLARLDRLVALKDLGFTLDQVRPILDGEVSTEELRGMLRLRRTELAAQIAADTDRLDRVERRLRALEGQDTMSDLLQENETRVTAVEGHRLATLSTTVAGLDDIGPAVGPLFGRLTGLLAAAGAPLREPTVATYTIDDDGRVEVTVGFPAPDGPVDGAEIVTLPALDRAARAVYRGGMDRIGEAWQELLRWCESEGLALDGSSREIYLASPMDDPQGWVTELQQPVRAR